MSKFIDLKGKTFGRLKVVERTATRLTTHGKTKSPVYHAWQHMLSRCYNPNEKHYHHYGGRGIRVCKRWHKFENFYLDMGDRPPGRSLDRINNNKGYSPKNCRWASWSQQARNRRNNIYLEYKGERRVMSEWAEIYKIDRHALRARLIKYSWPVERALTEPVRPYSRKQQNN